jgi:hypothetical protein
MSLIFPAALNQSATAQIVRNQLSERWQVDSSIRHTLSIAFPTFCRPPYHSFRPLSTSALRLSVSPAKLLASRGSGVSPWTTWRCAVSNASSRAVSVSINAGVEDLLGFVLEDGKLRVSFSSLSSSAKSSWLDAVAMTGKRDRGLLVSWSLSTLGVL